MPCRNSTLIQCPSWRVSWSVRCGALLFNIGFNERVLADPLIATIQRKDSLHHAVRVTPIHNTAVRVVRGSRLLSAAHGQSPPYAAAYLDDIIIHSNDWLRHMEHLRAVLRSLRVAGLMANPRKCAIGWVVVRYLGFHLGHGQVRPQIDKMAAVAACPSPKTKKEVRQFLGLAGYYRRFIPNYSDLTSLLTYLTSGWSCANRP